MYWLFLLSSFCFCSWFFRLKYSSFRRQLCLFGFQKKTNKAHRNCGITSHPDFVRGDPYRASRIQSKEKLVAVAVAAGSSAAVRKPALRQALLKVKKQEDVPMRDSLESLAMAASEHGRAKALSIPKEKTSAFFGPFSPTQQAGNLLHIATSDININNSNLNGIVTGNYPLLQQQSANMLEEECTYEYKNQDSVDEQEQVRTIPRKVPFFYDVWDLEPVALWNLSPCDTRYERYCCILNKQNKINDRETIWNTTKMEHLIMRCYCCILLARVASSY